MSGSIAIGIAVGLALLFLGTDTLPSAVLFATPYITTLVVLAFASQRLRMPAADGLRYRRGEGR